MIGGYGIRTLLQVILIYSCISLCCFHKRDECISGMTKNVSESRNKQDLSKAVGKGKLRQYLYFKKSWLLTISIQWFLDVPDQVIFIKFEMSDIRTTNNGHYTAWQVKYFTCRKINKDKEKLTFIKKINSIKTRLQIEILFACLVFWKLICTNWNTKSIKMKKS